MIRLITANARTVTPAEFLDYVLGPRMSREEAGERAVAWHECQAAMRERQDGYRAQLQHDDRCRARYAERLREIADKYALAPVERGIAPDNGNERVAA